MGQDQKQSVNLHESADLAVGFLAYEGIENSAFHLTERLPRKGDTIAAFTISRLEVVPVERRSFQLEFAPELIYSELEEHWPTGRDRTFLPNNCFQAPMSTEGGNSGGVYDKQLIVKLTKLNSRAYVRSNF